MRGAYWLLTPMVLFLLPVRFRCYWLLSIKCPAGDEVPEAAGSQWDGGSQGEHACKAREGHLLFPPVPFPFPSLPRSTSAWRPNAPRRIAIVSHRRRIASLLPAALPASVRGWLRWGRWRSSRGRSARSSSSPPCAPTRSSPRSTRRCGAWSGALQCGAARRDAMRRRVMRD